MALAGATGVFILTRVMRRLRPRAQVVVLACLGVCIGFTLFVLVQLQKFSVPLGVLLMATVFAAGYFGVPIFMRSLNEENDQESDDESSVDPQI